MKEAFETVYLKLKQMSLDKNILCREFWLKIIALNENFDEAACWELVIENIEWLINTKTVSSYQLCQWFTKEELSSHGIYTEGKHRISNAKAIGIADAQIEAMGHSRVILFDRAMCRAFDNTFVTGFNDSAIELKNCCADAFHKCRVTATDFSKVEAWDNATVKAETYSCVMAHDNAQVHNSENSHVIVV